MSNETYEMTIEDREEYVYACVTAPMMSLQIGVDYSNQLMFHLRTTGHKKVLFIRETPEMASEAHYSVVASILANMLPAHITLAVVDRSHAHQFVKEAIRAEAETKAKNINAFDTFEEAEEWLLNAL
jgi:outer membrane receptor for monomeric catechols